MARQRGGYGSGGVIKGTVSQDFHRQNSFLDFILAFFFEPDSDLPEVFESKLRKFYL